jgi:hypothetical protein
VLKTLAATPAVRPWDSIPGVAFVGIMIGVVLLIAAIRAMFGKRGR